MLGLKNDNKCISITNSFVSATNFRLKCSRIKSNKSRSNSVLHSVSTQNKHY